MQKQQFNQKLQQRISPQQIQFIRLLELPFLEMEERIKQELDENPVLEEGGDDNPDDMDDNEFEADDRVVSNENDIDLILGDYRTEDDIPDYKLNEISSRVERREEIPFSLGLSLHEYLLEQLGLKKLSDREQKIGEYIIGNIDDDGYLRRDFRAITDDLMFKAGEEVPEKEIEPVLSIIQDFDPPGIGARDLQECLLLQLKKKKQTSEIDSATQILTHCFEPFVKKRYDKIMESLSITEERLKELLPVILSLNPKPGGSWSGPADMTMNQITPDFIVEAIDGELTLTLNQRGIPDLHISREYIAMLQDYTGNKANQTIGVRDAILFVKQKLDSAQWFIDAIRQRQETLQRTMQTIMFLQTEFFLTGDETKLRPLKMKDVAERSGYDISTISRASNCKYVQTNFGIYLLKYFFAESTQNDSGEETTTREVKKILKEILEVEDKRYPVNDDVLAALLKEKGYSLARRTVAKYREQMGVPVARLRKEL
jgi:RNA polymerase sigma-54 factor